MRLGEKETMKEREDNLNKLLSLLEQHQELRFRDLKVQIGVSDPTLAEYVKNLENQNKIEAFFKPEDRRNKWYKIKHENREKVEAQIRKYEAIKSIEETPLEILKPKAQGKYIDVIRMPLSKQKQIKKINASIVKLNEVAEVLKEIRDEIWEKEEG